MSAPIHVSLFVTCLTDLFAPHVGTATVRVLEHFGCTVDFPQDQTCCGQPQFNNGYHPHAADLARRMIRVFAHSTLVVTPSASCCAMIRQHYPALFAGDPAWRKPAADLAAKTYELVEFLTQILKVDLAALALPRPTSVACHYSCHNRGLGQSPEAIAGLIGTLGNVTTRPLEKAEQCCGFGGTFAVKFPEISAAIAGDKAACAARCGADVLLVNDAGCALNIAGTCHRQGQSTQIRHLAELLASAIDHQAQPHAGGPP